MNAHGSAFDAVAKMHFALVGLWISRGIEHAEIFGTGAFNLA